MKGLLLKDFYMSVRYCRAFLALVLVFLCISFCGEENLFFIVYPTMVTGIIPMSLLAYDERDKWNVYSGALPYSRAQLVSAKYFIGLLFSVCAFLLSLASMSVRLLLTGAFSVQSFAALAATLLSLGLVGPTILLPFAFKWGPEKARLAFYIMIILISGIGGVLAGLSIDLSCFSAGIWTILPVGIVLILYCLSWRLSIHFYEKREL